ncbi:superoxide dismutase family protein [Streptomyces sp. NBC_00234]|uniref:superoxide dismutase family protein n=1 Tax=Streptomyces sp. NBC_00234 TaxID=2903638 RepID=UPI002E2C3C55|nr:superoxide dismutase family protein [Streptomyces sp. NBC_00234]
MTAEGGDGEIREQDMVAAGTFVRAVGAVAGAAALVMLTGGASGAREVTAAEGVGAASRAGDVRGGGVWMRAQGSFAPPNAFVPSSAVTYAMDRVPAAAGIEIGQHSDESGTAVWARLSGLVPNRAYGMHVHTSPCGADPKAAGPHYQHRAEGHADPANEVWLDFRTDGEGNGESWVLHDWSFREGGARSVVIHDEQGGAGDRLACFTVPFGSYGRG